MKNSVEVIVFRERKTGEFLESYKDKGSLAYTAEFCCLTHCLKIPREKYEEDKKVYKALAKAFGCEVVAVRINYKLNYPNGSEVEPIERKKEVDSIERLLAEFEEWMEKN